MQFPAAESLDWFLKAAFSMAFLDVPIGVARCKQTRHAQSCNVCASKAPGIILIKTSKITRGRSCPWCAQRWEIHGLSLCPCRVPLQARVLHRAAGILLVPTLRGGVIIGHNNLRSRCCNGLIQILESIYTSGPWIS